MQYLKKYGNYFMWNNQWFHTWWKFHISKELAYYHESYLTFLHYKNDGTMVDDTVLLSKHFGNGVGQHNANWDNIEKVPGKPSQSYSTVQCPLKNTAGTKNLYLVFKGVNHKNLFSIDWFKFE